MKRVLLCSFRFPYPLTDGAKIRIYNISRILAQKYLVDLLVINEGEVVAEHLKKLENIFNKVIVFSYNPLKFKINTMKGLISRDPLQTYYYYFKDVQQWIDNHYNNYDLLFCFHIRTARYFYNLSKPKVIDLIDATSINYREARGKGLWKLIYPIERSRLLHYELQTIKKFDKAFITSPYDKKYLEENIKNAKPNLIVIPNGVKEELINRAKKFFEKEENWLVFLGKMSYAPNVDAVTYFAKEIFPLVRKKADVKFFIVGTSPAKEVLKLRKLDGVEVTGFVEDPYEYLEKAKLVVAPLRFSAGIQNKVLEAMALKKAVVTTTKAARSIEGENGKHFIVADNPKEMASKILELLNDSEKRKAIGEHARALIEEKYTWNVVKEKLLKEIEELM